MRGRQYYSYIAYFGAEPVHVKVYHNVEDAEHAFKVVSYIRKKNPSTFYVPKALKLVKKQDQAVLITEYVEGCNLDDSVHKFLQYGNRKAIDDFHNVGRALRELHEMKIDGLTKRDFGSSQTQLAKIIKKDVCHLSQWGVLTPSARERILEFVRNADSTNTDLFRQCTLHGDFEHFSHVFLSKRERVFLIDFDKTCRGAPHYDITKFLASLFSSLLVSKGSLKKLLCLRQAFLDGYFAGAVPNDSIRITELFTTVRLTRLILYRLAGVKAPGPKYLSSDYDSTVPLLALFKFTRLKQLLHNMPLPHSSHT